MMENFPEIGIEGQRKLIASSVLVVGIGGLGCAALPYLAAAGIKRIGLIDFDKVEKSNLERQTLFGHSDIGRWKVQAAKEKLAKMYSEVLFEAEILQMTPQNVLHCFSAYDLILDGTDNLQARLTINDACRLLRKPWVYGSAAQWEGQVALFLPGNSDYRSLFPEGDMKPSINCSSGGILGPFVGMIGMMQAVEAIKWLAGVDGTLAGKILTINGKTYRFFLANVAPQVVSYQVHYSLLLEWLAKEPVQFMHVSETYSALNKKQKVVVYCETGQRSIQRMRQLRQEGFDAYSLGYDLF
jgi:sulfur-carrier protein adenylyltransferase/sulfurtransferase